jgi:hypothetical protein
MGVVTAPVKREPLAIDRLLVILSYRTPLLRTVEAWPQPIIP